MLKNTTIKTPNELDVKHLLQECGLPVSDITPKHLEHFFGFSDDSGLLGVVGLEVFGSLALLRSLAVSSKHRKNGIGRHLVAHAEQYAHTMCAGHLSAYDYRRSILFQTWIFTCTSQPSPARYPKNG